MKLESPRNGKGISQVPKSNFDALLDDMTELDARRDADPQLLKALRNAGDSIRRSHEHDQLLASIRALNTRAVARRGSGGNVQSGLKQRVAQATSLLKAAVAEGRLGAIDACAFEAKIHHMNEGIR
jgi:hypothetical protein